MKLKNSSAFRLSYEGNLCREVTLTKGTPFTEPMQTVALNFGFDLGSSKRHELARLSVGVGDFEALAATMVELDKDAAFKAFANAMLRSYA
jgi:hypothetical protein